MAALPQSNTERWWCIYTTNNTTHRVMCRTLDGTTATQMASVFGPFFTQMATHRTSTTILGLERALKNSNVRIPFAYSGSPPGGTGSDTDNDGRARVFSFVGRSLDGRRTKIFMFGANATPEGDYRLDTSESAALTTQVNWLNAAVGVFLSISGQQPIWKAYANIGYNDHWIKEYRKG